MCSASDGGRSPEAAGTDERRRRRVLWSLPTGLYVIGSRADRRWNLMTASWVTQVATEPTLIGVGVEATALTHELIAAGGIFAVSLLPRAERTLVRSFVKPASAVAVDPRTGRGTIQGAAVHAERTGAPVLDVAAAWLDCELRHTVALGSHSWFVGEVVDAAFGPAGEGLPILRMEDTRMHYGG